MAQAVLHFGRGEIGAHYPEKYVLDLIGDGNRYSDKVVCKENISGPC